MTRLWRRVSKIPSEYKKLRSGGRQLQEYLEKEWLFRLDDGEVQTRQEVELEKKVTELNKENQVLQKEAEKARSREEKAQERAARLSDQLLKAKEQGYTPTRGRTRIKSPSKCSKRHLRNLKRKREG